MKNTTASPINRQKINMPANSVPTAISPQANTAAISAMMKKRSAQRNDIIFIDHIFNN